MPLLKYNKFSGREWNSGSSSFGDMPYFGGKRAMAGGSAPQMHAVMTLGALFSRVVRGFQMGGGGLGLIPDFCRGFEHTIVLECRQAGKTQHDEGRQQEGGHGHEHAGDGGESERAPACSRRRAHFDAWDEGGVGLCSRWQEKGKLVGFTYRLWCTL